jgi:hypothetical protein
VADRMGHLREIRLSKHFRPKLLRLRLLNLQYPVVTAANHHSLNATRCQKR